MHYPIITATHYFAGTERVFVVDSFGEATIEPKNWTAPRMLLEPTIEHDRGTTSEKAGSQS